MGMKLCLRNPPTDEKQWWSPMHLPEFTEKLSQYFDVVEDQDQAEVVIQDHTLDVTHSRTIILDRFDAAQVTRETAEKFENNPFVIGYLIPLSSWNSPSLTVTSWGVGEVEKPVGVITTMLWQQLLGNTFYAENPPIEKPFDVSFAGTTGYPHHHWTQLHRQEFQRKFSELNWRGRLRGVGVFNSTDTPRLLSWEDAYRLTANSKVVICPHGVCEISWRDYEAVLGGAVMVKPEGPPILSTTLSPWRGNWVKCKQDFSDLQEAISNALDLYDEDRLNMLREQALFFGSDLDFLARSLAIQVCCITQGADGFPHAVMEQSPHALDAILSILRGYGRPDTIIEIGTGKGGLTRLLSQVCTARIHTWDCHDLWELDFTPKLVTRHLRSWPEDLENIQHLIDMGGRTWVLCDNGNKPHEMQVFPHLLKNGDLIFCHDYFDDRDVFQEERNAGRWFWHECSAQQLPTKMRGFLRLNADQTRKAAWGVWQKPLT